MSNVKPVLDCPKCKTHGEITNDSRLIKALVCPKCGMKWSTYVGGKVGDK